MADEAEIEEFHIGDLCCLKSAYREGPLSGDMIGRIGQVCGPRAKVVIGCLAYWYELKQLKIPTLKSISQLYAKDEPEKVDIQMSEREEWSTHKDKKTKKNYYWNKITNETTYDKPSCLKKVGVGNSVRISRMYPIKQYRSKGGRVIGTSTKNGRPSFKVEMANGTCIFPGIEHAIRIKSLDLKTWRKTEAIQSETEIESTYDSSDYEGKLIFCLGREVHPSVREFLRRSGWGEFEEPYWREERDEDHHWNLFWQDRLFTPDEYLDIQWDQRFNHFPMTACFARKDYFALRITNMRKVYGQVYEVLPPTYVLPEHEKAFKKALGIRKKKKKKKKKQRKQGTGSTMPAEGEVDLGYWIHKPSSGARAKGIYILEDVLSFIKTYDGEPCVLQRYISNPQLVEGYKNDLRIYVLVTSFWPLKAFIHRKGLAHFATEKYDFDMEEITNQFSHLTNTTLNKRNENPEQELIELTGNDEGGQKWTLEQFWTYLKIQGIDCKKLWKSVKRVILLSLLSIVGEVPVHPHCYEIMGYDVMFDSKFKPWVMEANRSPAMATRTKADKVVKKTMLADMLKLQKFDHDHITGPRTPFKDRAPAPIGTGTDIDPGIRIKQNGEWSRRNVTQTPYGGWERLFPFNKNTEDASYGLINQIPPPQYMKPEHPSEEEDDEEEEEPEPETTDEDDEGKTESKPKKKLLSREKFDRRHLKYDISTSEVLRKFVDIVVDELKKSDSFPEMPPEPEEVPPPPPPKRQQR